MSTTKVKKEKVTPVKEKEQPSFWKQKGADKTNLYHHVCSGNSVRITKSGKLLVGNKPPTIDRIQAKGCSDWIWKSRYFSAREVDRDSYSKRPPYPIHGVWNELLFVPAENISPEDLAYFLYHLGIQYQCRALVRRHQFRTDEWGGRLSDVPIENSEFIEFNTVPHPNFQTRKFKVTDRVPYVEPNSQCYVLNFKMNPDAYLANGKWTAYYAIILIREYLCNPKLINRFMEVTERRTEFANLLPVVLAWVRCDANNRSYRALPDNAINVKGMWGNFLQTINGRGDSYHTTLSYQSEKLKAEWWPKIRASLRGTDTFETLKVLRDFIAARTVERVEQVKRKEYLW